MLAETIDAPKTEGARRFLAYWNSLPKESLVPDRRVFNPVAIAKLMPAVTILEIWSDEKIIQRLTGTAVCRAMGFDPTGRNMLDVIAPEARNDYLKLINAQIGTPCGRWNVLKSRNAGMIVRSEVLTLPMRHAASGNFMILSYFSTLEQVAFDPGPFEIVGYEETRWIDIGAGVPDWS